LAWTDGDLRLAYCLALSIPALAWFGAVAHPWRSPEAAWTFHGATMAGIALAFGGLSRVPVRRNAAFAATLFAYAVAGSSLIVGTATPGIDVYLFHQVAGRALAAGHMPYAVPYPDIYPPDISAQVYGRGVSVNGYLTHGYPYPPLSLLVSALGTIALGDPRWAHLAAQLVAAGCIGLARPSAVAVLTAALFLWTPAGGYVLYWAWTEPVVVAMFASATFLLARAPRWFSIGAGLWLASKQYLVLAAPSMLLALPRPLRARPVAGLLATIAGVVAVVTAPFFAWDFAATFRGVIAFQFIQPARFDGLGYTAAAARLAGIAMPGWSAFAAAAVAQIWVLRAAPRTRAGFAAASAFVLLVFFAFSKQAMANYYYFALGALASALAVESGDEPAAPVV
jgi:hypothetical protein